MLKRIAILYGSLLIGICACGDKSVGTFFAGTLGLGEARVIIASVDNTANSINYAVVMYDTSGKFISILSDYTLSNEAPRGLAQISPFKFIVPIDGNDRIDVLDIFGNKTSQPDNTQFNGVLADVIVDSQGRRIAIEANTIEMFDSTGDRVNGVSATPFIAATTGTCILNNPRTMAFTPSGNLVVANFGLNNLLIYSISGTTATCVGPVAAPNGPYAILMHSDGNIYVARRTSPAVFRASTTGANQTDVYSNASYINLPTAMAELPDQTILVANDGINSIERIDTSGNRIGTFIQDAFTNNVSDIIVLRGQ